MVAPFSFDTKLKPGWRVNGRLKLRSTLVYLENKRTALIEATNAAIPVLLDSTAVF